MSLQFLVEANQRNIQTLQVLPNFFTERLYPVNPWIYLTHNRGTKHKVYIEKVPGRRFKLYSDEWRTFLHDSRYQNVATFHFIREEEDCYYVTAYDNAGSECNGYDLALVGYRQRRCLVMLGHLQESPLLPIQFLPNTANDQFRVLVSGVVVATVTRRLINQQDENIHGHVFGGHRWHALLEAEHLLNGTRLAFTNLLNNSVSMMPFDASGLEFRSEIPERLFLNEDNPIMRNPIDTDERMQHMCVWEGHREHDNEKDCFYSPILAYVIYRSRLTIPHEFVKPKKMFEYQNALLQHDGHEFYVDLELVHHSDRPNSKNHVNIKARWSNIVTMCDWDDNKMVRFKLVAIVKDVRRNIFDKDPVFIPVFHMC